MKDLFKTARGFPAGLMQKFLICLILGVSILVLGMASLVSTATTGYVMSRNTASTALYMQSFLEPNVQSMAENGTLSAADFAAITAVSKDRYLGQHVIAIKIWDVTGRVVFATDRDLIGQSFPLDDIQPALEGRIEAYLDDLTAEENAQERKIGTPIFEIYVPLRHRATNEVIAIGEFYEDASQLQKFLTETLWNNRVALGLGGLIFGASLFWIVRQGSQTISKQALELIRMQAKGQKLAMELEQKQAALVTAQADLREVDSMVQRRIGQELHDGPAQLLAFLMLNLDDLTRVQQRSSQDLSLIQDVKDATIRAQKEIRDISNRLVRVGEPSQDAPPPRLSDIIAEYVDRSHVEVAQDGVFLADLLSNESRAAIGAIVGEALNNGFKHARGRGQSVQVMLKNQHMWVMIFDSGPGFPSETELRRKQAAGHLGFSGMQAQAARIGAELAVSRTDDGQTVVCVTLALEKPAN